LDSRERFAGVLDRRHVATTEVIEDRENRQLPVDPGRSSDIGNPFHHVGDRLITNQCPSANPSEFITRSFDESDRPLLRAGRVGHA
jgi:hypothetical protein